MNDQASLLAGILANPADDAPRLIYADWLDENAGESDCAKCNGVGQIPYCGNFVKSCNERGKKCDCTTCGGCSRCDSTGRVSNHLAERAEFIRVQCELAKWDCSFKQTREQPGWRHNCGTDENHYWLCQPLRSREREFLTSHGFTWFEMPGFATYSSKVGGPFEGWLLKESGQPGIEIPVAVRRGFIDEIRLTLAQFLQHARQIAAQHPVTTWVLTDVDDELASDGWDILLPPTPASLDDRALDWLVYWRRNVEPTRDKEWFLKQKQQALYAYARMPELAK